MLAREVSGKTKATYTRLGSRAALGTDPVFVKAFQQAADRICLMDVRFVEENNPIRQALLEIYAAVVLDTPYNRFDPT